MIAQHRALLVGYREINWDTLDHLTAIMLRLIGDP
jgi:hypothetical protein